jgi:hypothetical protein
VKYLETITVPIDLPQDYPGNARVHDDDWLDGTVAPGQHRSIFARRLEDGTIQILAGHGTRAALKRKGDRTVRVEVVEADDTEARRVNLSDNPPPGIGGFDDTALLALLDEASLDGGLSGTGWDADRYTELLSAVADGNPFAWPPPGQDDGQDDDEDESDGDYGDDADPYTKAVNVPQYEPKGACPAVAELCDDTRAEQLREHIWAADVPEELRDYLLAAAARHTVFNYRKAAEFYPHASPQVQRLMEESALVIIDVDEALRLGYLKLDATLSGLEGRDRADR